MSWTTFIEAAPAADHAVQVYDELAELAVSVGNYIDAGFRRGEPAVLISTADHLQVFAAELEARGWDVDSSRPSGWSRATPRGRRSTRSWTARRPPRSASSGSSAA